MLRSHSRSAPCRLAIWMPAATSMVLLISPAAAECPGAGPPHVVDEVNHTPQLLEICHNFSGMGGCDAPQAPTVTNAGTLAQGMTLQATVPANFTATKIWWRADMFDPAVGPVECGRLDTGICRDFRCAGTPREHVSRVSRFVL